MINVVYCVTADYIDKIKPSIRSLRDFNDAKIYVVTEASECDIPNVEVIDIRGQKWFKPESCVNYHNPFTYIGLLKVCYAELLPCDKVIHMDADTIINGNLQELYDTDLDGKWFGMVEEKTAHYRPFGEHYYNAGVFLLNLKQMREDKIQNKMVEYLNTVPQPFCEQDAFDKFGIENDKIVEVETKWNESCATGYTLYPKVIHYCAITDWWTSRTMDRVEYLDTYR